MIYFENSSRGEEGLNTHVMSYVLAISMSRFLDREFYFDYEIPCSTPPDFASKSGFEEKFGVVMTSGRSLVTDLLDMPARRVFEIDRDVSNKVEYQLLFSYFMTTEAMRRRFEGTFIWDAFGVGRVPLTREELQKFELIEWTHTKLSAPAIFYFLPAEEKRELLASVRVRYAKPIEDLATKIVAEMGGVQSFNAVHSRLGDFRQNYAEDEYSINEELFAKYIAATFPDRGLPVLIATDGLDEKAAFERMFAGYQLTFVDELILGEFRHEYLELPFTDFNSLTILNQLICAAADIFIGTYRSTFTGMIHRLRQERYDRRDFAYFPDAKVAKLLNEKLQIMPDRSGFFDWNRYSIFSEDHGQMCWMREWDHERSILNG
jgi:hypothetical protein